MTAHSKFGASSASRWLNCPGSIQLSATVPPQKSSDYALEGTVAHKLAEICLINSWEPINWVGHEICLDDKEQEKYLVTENMAEAVQVYVDYVRSKRGEMNIETKFDLSFIEQGMFGTNDCCIYNKQIGLLEVIDYKHGSGIAVSPVENTQLAYYGLGAAKIYELHPNSMIKLTIVQPRAAGDAIKSWTTTVGYLENFAKILKKGVKACKAKNPELVSGSWCKFCPASAVCPKLYEQTIAVAQADFADDGAIVLPVPENLNKVDIKKVLDFSDTLGSWLKAVETFAYSMLERGEKIEGYKLVKKRSNRKWIGGEEEAVSSLIRTLGLSQDKDLMSRGYFAEPKLKSPAQLEKVLDKNLIASLCESPDNGNTLVSVSDKRPEVLPSIQSDFEPIELED